MKKPANPTFPRFCAAIIDVLKESGGSASPTEVIDLVIDNLNIPETELEKKSDAGLSYVKNQIYWARFRLLKLGYLDLSQKGVWSLTEKGARVNFGENDEAKIPDIDHKTELLGILRALPAEGFDRICQRLLRESGFQQVVVTRRSASGDIEGHGVMRVNPFISFNALFQCKRSEATVGTAHIRDFRAAIMGRADRGMILTTGAFTMEARNESRRYGLPPVEIIDGEKLVEVFEWLQLGLTPRQIYIIDQRFFDDFR